MYGRIVEDKGLNRLPRGARNGMERQTTHIAMHRRSDPNGYKMLLKEFQAPEGFAVIKQKYVLTHRTIRIDTVSKSLPCPVFPRSR